MNIRPYKETDYPMICSWWKDHKEQGPLPGMMGEGTFILEYEGLPILCLSVLCTQTNIAYLEGFISHPGLYKEIRNKLSKVLWDHCINYATEKGYKHLFCYASKESLVNKYQEFGMTKCENHLVGLGREL